MKSVSKRVTAFILTIFILFEVMQVGMPMLVNAADPGEEAISNMKEGWFWPLPSDCRKISSPFLKHRSWFDANTLKWETDIHQGIDIIKENGSVEKQSIFSARSGIVYRTGKKHESMGNYVCIRHGKNSEGKYVFTTYMHMLREPSVKEGDLVDPYTVLGQVGSTGKSSGNHLHFHIFKSTSKTPNSVSPNHSTDSFTKANYEDPSPRSTKLPNGINYTYLSNAQRNQMNSFLSKETVDLNLVTSIDNAVSRKHPLVEAAVVNTYKNKNTSVHAKMKVVNVRKNEWYLLDDGSWIFSERVSEKPVAPITMHATKGSNVKTNKKVTGVPPAIVAKVDESITVIGPAPKLEGYTFLGYARKENAKKAEYQIGSKIEKVPAEGLNLYPVWRQDELTMSLSAYKAELDVTDITVTSKTKKTIVAEVHGNLDNTSWQVDAVSDALNVATVSVTDNYFFDTWISIGNGIFADKLTANINITAISPGNANIIVSVIDKQNNAKCRQTITVIVDKQYTVRLLKDNGSEYLSKKKSHGINFVLSDMIPEKEGNYSFMGWAPTLGASMPLYGPGDLYKTNESIDLYPVWVANHGITEPSFADGVLTINGRGNMPSYPTGKTKWNQYKAQATRIVIDPEITSIGSNAFAGFNKVTEVDIPEGVQYIGNNAFSGTGLKSVLLPTSVRVLGNKAFGNCKDIEYIGFSSSSVSSSAKFKKGLSSDLSIEIGAFAFENCVSLASIDLPNSVSELGAGAFNGCSNLTTVDLPENLKTIEDSTFFGCSSLIDLEIPESVRIIGDSSFDGCSALPKVELPGSLTELGDRAFAGCSALEAIELPNGVKSYGAGTFTNCSALTDVDLPEGMTQVPDAMFSGCTALKAVELPESVEIVGDGAFRGCSALEPVQFSEQVTKISNNAFQGCDSIDSVAIPASVTEVGDYAFFDCDNLKALTLNEGLVKIGTAAFAFCDSLESAAIPASVTLLDDGAFMGCSALAEVELLESPITIGDDVFFDCSSLTGIQLPESIVSLGENVFGGCANSFTVSCFSTASIYDQVVDTCANVDTIYPVTGVSLSKTTAAMHAGETLQLQAIIAPATATDKSVIWTTNHPEIATVDESGLVTTIKGGTVVITATTNDNKLVAQCEITVTVPVKGFDLDWRETNAYVDDSFQLMYSFEPVNPTEIGVTWSSSNDRVVTVSEDGTVSIVGVGNATITATTADGGYTSSCTINTEEYISVEEIVIDNTEISLRVGETTELNVSVFPENATEQYVSFVIEEDEGIVEFKEDGTITALKPGTVVITVTIGGGEEKTCTVTVLPKRFTVTWVVNGVETEVEYESGEAIQQPADPNINGFVFQGWTPEVPEIMPEKDMTFIAVFEEASSRIPGDADDSGTVTLRDAAMISRYLAGGWDVTINTDNADVDGSGTVTLRDAAMISRYLAGGWDVELI